MLVQKLPLNLSKSGFYCLTLSCVISRSLWGNSCAVCLRRHHDHSVQLLSALSGCFLWHCPSNTLSLGPPQGHIWCERSYTQVHKPKYGLPYPQGAFFYLFQERCLVLRCTVDPKGTPLRLMVSGFLTSHLRNMPHLDCPGGGCSHGLASGTGPGFVMCFFNFSNCILPKNICQGCCRIKCFRTFMVRKLLLFLKIFSLYLHSEKQLKL